MGVSPLGEVRRTAAERLFAVHLSSDAGSVCSRLPPDQSDGSRGEREPPSELYVSSGESLLRRVHGEQESSGRNASVEESGVYDESQCSVELVVGRGQKSEVEEWVLLETDRWKRKEVEMVRILDLKSRTHIIRAAFLC